MQEDCFLSDKNSEEFQKIEITSDNCSWIKATYSLFNEGSHTIEYPILCIPEQAKQAIHEEPYYADIAEYCHSEYIRWGIQ